MNLMRQLTYICLVLCVIAAVPACALLKTPVPVTQIQLSIDTTQLQWPLDVHIKSVKARALLRTDRVIVTQGALVMQHAGVRWVSEPASQLLEQLSFAHASAMTQPMSKRVLTTENRLLDIQLNAFNIEALANGDTRIVVSASGSVQCSADPLLAQLAPVQRIAPLNSAEPQRIAQGFNEAARVVMSTLVNQAKSQCGR